MSTCSRSLLLVLALAAGLAALAPGSAAAQCTGVVVSSPEVGAATPATRFWASDTLDLTFTVLLPSDLSGEHLLSLAVRLPSGDLFRTIDEPLAAAGTSRAAASSGRTVRGYPHPVPELVPSPTTRGTSQSLAVEVPFPVAGTSIVANSLYGRWQVVATMDGASAPCAATSFSLVSGAGIFTDGVEVGSTARWSGGVQ